MCESHSSDPFVGSAGSNAGGEMVHGIVLSQTFISQMELVPRSPQMKVHRGGTPSPDAKDSEEERS